MTHQKSVLKPGLKIDVDASDTRAQLIVLASETSNLDHTFTFLVLGTNSPPIQIQVKVSVGFSATLNWPPLSLSKC